MGTLRFILSLIVVASHMMIFPGDYHLGVMSVIVFLIISGYAMTKKIEANYMHTSKVGMFYMDRIIRLYPQLFFYLVLYNILCVSLELDDNFLANSDPVQRALEFLIIPQDLYMFLGTRVAAIPPAWTIGLEMCFYLLFPWLLLLNNRHNVYSFAIVSVFVYLLAFYNFIDPDYYGYRLLPGTLFIFLIGWAISNNDKKYLGATLLLSAFLIYTSITDILIYDARFSREVCLAILIGTVAVYLVKDRTWSKDRLLGDLSYGIYLNHILLIWMMQKFTGTEWDFSITQVAFVIIASISLSAITLNLIEKPAFALRRRFKGNLKPQPQVSQCTI